MEEEDGIIQKTESLVPLFDDDVFFNGLESQFNPMIVKSDSSFEHSSSSSSSEDKATTRIIQNEENTSD